jgi:hypothetical protein
MTAQAKGRRTFTLSLPASDPNSAVILDWLDQQRDGADVGRLMRQALATWLTCAPLMERMAAQLDRVEARLDGAGPLALPAEVVQPLDEERAAALDLLLDFGHLD